MDTVVTIDQTMRCAPNWTIVTLTRTMVALERE